LQTLELIRHVKYSFCYVFPYSMRERTRAYHRLNDDVPLEVKQQRHLELAKVFREQSLILNKSLIGSVQLVLVESVCFMIAVLLRNFHSLLYTSIRHNPF
uniref:CDK5RAP1-like protein (inferred by orthology to a C. elegans protein) n=1 Tax=Anisakis simplex TaxID=6269 RepID=A0A0M3KCB6_ANISI